MLIDSFKRNGGGGGGSGWSDIQRELLEAILRKLPLVDYLKCRRVCRCWQHIVDDAVAIKGKGKCTPAPQFPFLMLLPPPLIIRRSRLPPLIIRRSGLPPLIINQPAASLTDITQQEEQDTSYPIRIQTWKGYFDFDRVFTVQGWLVFQNIYCKENHSYDSILFSNPLSGQHFQLPHLTLFPMQAQDQDPFSIGVTIFVKLVFSSASLDSQDFFVVASATRLDSDPHRFMQRLAFCKVTHNKWTQISTVQSHRFAFDEFIILDHKLYAMSKDFSRSSCVTIFNLTNSDIISFQKMELVPIPFRMPLWLDGYETCMLARDGDQILLLLHHTSCGVTKGFRIFKLDISASKWIELHDLGDSVLFMDSAGIQVISAKEIKLPRNLSGGNCVFFCITNSIKVFPFLKRDLGVFTLKDKRITGFPLSNCIQVSGHRFLWFSPC